MNETGRRAIEIGMQGLQQEYGLTGTESCQVFNEAADEMAREMHLSVAQPDIYSAMRL